jgi:hypothetical protein
MKTPSANTPSHAALRPKSRVIDSLRAPGYVLRVLRTFLSAAILLLLALGTPLSERLLEAAPMPAGAEASTGEREVQFLAEAWPDRIVETAQGSSDWMLRIGDDWFAWAHGRLMPEADRAHWQDFAAIPFYPYPLDMPPLPELDEQTASSLRQRVRDNQKNPPRRNEAFLAALLQAHNRAETEARLISIEVAGFTVTVHERIREPLSLVGKELMSLRLVDPGVEAFLRGIREMNGYNYRFVEGTRSRSLHSYGLAIDLIPKSYKGKNAYWMWAMTATPDWWTIPYARRWMLPMPVVRAFERQGFVWGGKWLYFDTMHFEYRPEILLLARHKAATPTVSAPQS